MFPNSTVIGIDRDNEVSVNVDKLKQQYGERFHFSQSKFSQLLINPAKVIPKQFINKIDGTSFI